MKQFKLKNKYHITTSEIRTGNAVIEEGKLFTHLGRKKMIIKFNLDHGDFKQATGENLTDDQLEEILIAEIDSDNFYGTGEEGNEAYQTNGEQGEVPKEDEVFIAENSGTQEIIDFMKSRNFEGL